MDEPEPAFPVEPPEPKLAARKEHKQPWFTVVLAGMVSALATSLPTAYFSYRSAMVEADANKQKAEVGYQTIVDAVKKHEEHDMEQDKWIFKLEGHIESLEGLLARKAIETGDGSGSFGNLGGIGSGAGHHRPTQGKPAASTERILVPSQYKGVQLPDTLDNAFKAAAKK